MKYCRTCITPATRPNIAFDADGVCTGCAGHAEKREIDWAARAKDFGEAVSEANKQSSGYDCLIPVSGGKDSTWQVVRCLEEGLKPLAVSWKPPGRTALGARNLANLISLGVDHIDYQISPAVERKFMVKTLERLGSPAVPMHMAIFSIPLTLAVRFRIPLVVWGENSALEYGGTKEERRGVRLDGAWLKKFGVTHGTTARDWISEELTERELHPYFGPSDAELEAAGVRAVFLGAYFKWDPAETLKVAREHGFRPREAGPKTGFYNYADIDDDFISIHHHLKWPKFGFTRTYDNLSLEIRNGRMTREEAIRKLRERGDETPHADIKTFCQFTGLPRERFDGIVERFRNRDVWVRHNGTWMIEDFLISDWKWA